MMRNLLIPFIISCISVIGQDLLQCNSNTGQQGTCVSGSPGDNTCKSLLGTPDRGTCKENQLCCPKTNMFNSQSSPFNNLFPSVPFNNGIFFPGQPSTSNNFVPPFSSFSQNPPFNGPISSNAANSFPGQTSSNNGLNLFPPSFQNSPFSVPNSLPPNPFSSFLLPPGSSDSTLKTNNSNTDYMAALASLFNSAATVSPTFATSPFSFFQPSNTDSSNLNIPNFPFNIPGSANQFIPNLSSSNPFASGNYLNSNLNPPAIPNFGYPEINGFPSFNNPNILLNSFQNPFLSSNPLFPSDPFLTNNFDSLLTNSNGQSCGSTKSINSVSLAPRILGGITAKITDFCYQVVILDKDTNSFICSGSLIKRTWVLTTATCAKRSKSNSYRIILGDVLGICRQEIFTSSVIFHTGFNYPNGKSENNMALLRLSTPADTSKGCICTVCLNDQIDSNTNKLCRVSGYGSTSEGGTFPVFPLRVINVTIVPSATCQVIMQYNHIGWTLDPSQTCVIGKNGEDSCRGDGGGPLTCWNENGVPTLYGIVSSGVGCGRQYPSLCTNIANGIQFIRTYTGP